MRSLMAAFVSNNVLANVALLIIIIMGLLAAVSLNRESMPRIELGLIEIDVPFPGADPEEVEEGISRRIEAEIDGMDGIKKYSTTSYEGGSETMIEIEDGYEVNDVRDRVRNAVDSISTFPAGTEVPRISVVPDDDEVLHLALWGDVPERQLKVWAETIRAELTRLPEVALVNVWNSRRYEITIEISKEKLLEYGLTLQEVGRAIREGSLNLSSGTIKAEGEDIRIRTIGRRYEGPDFESLVVRAAEDGTLITLDRIAKITDGFTENPSYATFQGKPCILVEIRKGPEDDALVIAKAAREFAEKKQSELPEGLNISPCFDDSEFIIRQLSLLSRNGLLGLLLVLAILWLFLDTRVSFWVAMGIPISLSGAIALMWMVGMTINELTLTTFIVVLGIIVDDAIVVGESIYRQRQEGAGPLEAATGGVVEMGAPVLAAVFTTIAAFLPLMFVPGYIGQIMFVMPVVVIAALLVSLVECLFILPTHLNHLPDPNRGAGHRRSWARYRFAAGRGLSDFARHIYAPVVDKAIEYRYLTLCIGLAVFMIVAGLVGGGVIDVVFWPPANSDFVYATVEFPPGTPPEVTRDALAQTYEGLERYAAGAETVTGDPLIKTAYTRVYQWQPSRGRIVAQLLETSKRGFHSQDVSVGWQKEVGVIPGAVRQSFKEDGIGLDGAPIEIWLLAKEMDIAAAAAEELKEKLKSYSGVYQIADDFRLGRTEVQIRLKPQAHRMGLNLRDVAQTLQAGYYGDEALRIQRGRDDMRVRVRFPRAERSTLAELERLCVMAPSGAEVPLRTVADVTLAQGYSSIHGTDGLRRVVVTASTDANVVDPSDTSADLSKGYLDDLTARHDNLFWTIEGVEASNQETIGGLKRGFVVALLGIFVIIATIFRSYLQPLLILLIIPFGMIGAALGHWALGIPITILSLFGIVALAGIVVNDNIVLIECFNNLLAQGTPFYQAIRDAAVRRFRAIFLTSASTCAGLSPLILEQDLEAQIVIPMAVAIAAGVAFATTLTLILIPAIIAVLNDVRRATHRLARGHWPTPEEVEPAMHRPGDHQGQSAQIQ